MYVKAQIKRVTPITDKCTCGGGMPPPDQTPIQDSV